MKKEFMLFLLFLISINIVFSADFQTFIIENLNYLIAVITFSIVFSIIQPIIQKSFIEEVNLSIVVSLAIAIGFSVIVFLSGTLIDQILALSKSSPIILSTIIIAALIIQLIFGEDKKVKIISAAILFGLLLFYLIVTGVFSSLKVGENSSTSSFNYWFLLLPIIFVIIFLIYFFLKRRKDNHNNYLNSTDPSAPVHPALPSITVRRVKVVVIEEEATNNEHNKYKVVNNKVGKDITIIKGKISLNSLENNKVKEIKVRPIDDSLLINFVNNQNNYKEYYIFKAKKKKNCVIKSSRTVPATGRFKRFRRKQKLIKQDLKYENLDINSEFDIKSLVPIKNINNKKIEISKNNLNFYNILVIVKDNQGSNSTPANAPTQIQNAKLTVKVKGMNKNVRVFLYGDDDNNNLINSNLKFDESVEFDLLTSIKIKKIIVVSNNAGFNNEKVVDLDLIAGESRTEEISLGAKLDIKIIPRDISCFKQLYSIYNGELTLKSLYDENGTEIVKSESSGNIIAYTKPVSEGYFKILGNNTDRGEVYSDIKSLKNHGDSAVFFIDFSNYCELHLNVKNVEGINEEKVNVEFNFSSHNFVDDTKNSGDVTFRIQKPRGEVNITFTKKGRVTTKKITLNKGVIRKDIILGGIIIFETRDGNNIKPNKKITISPSKFKLYNKEGIEISDLKTDKSGKLKAYVNENLGSVKFTSMGVDNIVSSISNCSIYSLTFDSSKIGSIDCVLNINVKELFTGYKEEDVMVSLLDDSNNQVSNSSNNNIKEKTDNNGNVILKIDNIPMNIKWEKYKLKLSKKNREQIIELNEIGSGIELSQGQNYNISDLKLGSVLEINATQLGSDIFSNINFTILKNIFFYEIGDEIKSSPYPKYFFFNTPINEDIQAEFEGIILKENINETESGKVIPINFEFPNQLKVVIVENNGNGTYNVVKTDNNVTYGRACESGYSNYDVSKNPHQNYFQLKQIDNFNIIFNPLTHEYKKYLIIKASSSSNCKLNTVEFNTFSGNEKNLTLNFTLFQNNQFGINQTIFSEKYNFLVILREKNFSQQSARIILNVKTATGLNFGNARINITEGTNNNNNIKLYDIKGIEIRNPKLDNNGFFEGYIFANIKGDRTLNVQITKMGGVMVKNIQIGPRKINSGDII